jgi:hypothetical protein
LFFFFFLLLPWSNSLGNHSRVFITTFRLNFFARNLVKWLWCLYCWLLAASCLTASPLRIILSLHSLHVCFVVLGIELKAFHKAQAGTIGMRHHTSLS